MSAADRCIRLVLFSAFLVLTGTGLHAQQFNSICTDFQTKTSEGWWEIGVSFNFPPGGPDGKYDYYLRCGDESGASQVWGPSKYHGDWTKLSAMGCGGIYSWDVCMFNDGDDTEVYEWRPWVIIGNPQFEARFNAPFKIAETGPLAGWHHVDAYFAPGPKPSEGWVMRRGTDADWNNLLKNVTRIEYGYDHTSWQTEEFGLDNMCLRDSVCEAICGTKYNDLNGNGILDSGEPVIKDWTFYLSNATTNLTATTDEKGRFCFYGIGQGTYTLSEELRGNFVPTLPLSGAYTVTMEANDYQEFIFLNHRPSPPCDSVRDVSLERSTCTYSLRIKNGTGTPITGFAYSVEGGKANTITTRPCAGDPIQPGSTEGLITFANPCPDDVWVDIQVDPEDADTYIFVEFTVYHEGHIPCIVSFFYKCSLEGKGECSLIVPDKLDVVNYEYTPNPFIVQYELKNTGNATLDVAKVQLVLPPYLITNDPLIVPVAPLAPNQSHVLQWSVTALRAATARDAVVEVLALTDDDRTLVQCEDMVHLPGVTDMTCDLETPDRINYDTQNGTYSPDPFTVRLHLHNHLDEDRTNIEAELDLTQAPHLELLAGETALKTMALIAAGASGSFSWQVHALLAVSEVDEPITARYRLDGHREWRECTADIIIERGIAPYIGSCAADGIDSVWFNSTHELLVPNPFQVYCMITNAGGQDLTGCTMKLNLTSPDLSIAEKHEIEWQETLQPGDTGVMMYMLKAEQNIPETIEVCEFVFSCNELPEDIICTHTVFIEGRNVFEQARSHKRLYFRAEEYGPLPAAQNVLIFAGSPTEMPWQAQGYPGWLEIAPQNSVTTEYADVAPNTTAMPIGRYEGTILIASAAPNSPSDIKVIYDVVGAVDAVPATAALPQSVQLGNAFPNPFSGTTTIAYRLTERAFISLDVYNMLGAKVRTLHSGVTAPGEYTTDFDAHGLPAGPYRIVLRSSTGMQSRMVVVR